MNPSQYRLMRTLEELDMDTHFLEGLRRGVRALSPDEADEQRRLLERLQTETVDLESVPAENQDADYMPVVPDEPAPVSDDRTVSLTARRIREGLKSGYREQSEELARLRRDMAGERGPHDSPTARRRA